ncbi:MAG TPA: hypothetical protein VMZ52_01990 [Bryobacteraceae bacterium]|nr:hypothetical protein [Bryobacteraceae bacterium]
MKRPNRTVTFSIVAVFVSGVLVGAFGHQLYTVKTVIAKVATNNPEEWRKKYVTEMQDRLKLDAGQTQQLNSILDQTRARYREVKERYRPEMKQIHEEQIQKVRAILNKEQQPEYDKLRRERDQRMIEANKKSGGV